MTTLSTAAAASRSASVGMVLLVSLVLALQFSPAIGLLGYSATSAPGWALVGLSRDVLVVLLLVAAALRGRRSAAAMLLPASASRALPASTRWALPASARWALWLAVTYTLLAVLSQAGLAALALNLRRLLLVPLLYAALLLLPWTAAQIAALLRLLLTSSVIVALLGVAERLAPEALWTEWLDIVAYATVNPLDPFGALPFHDSGRFFSWDLERWTGEPVRRAVSTYLEPTTLAAAMATGWTFALAQRARGLGSAGTRWLLALCGVLTLAKSFAVFALVLAAWRCLGVPSPRQIVTLTAGACVLALLADATGRLEGPLAHIAGLASAMHYLADGHWLGAGIGEAGNYTAGLEEMGEVGTESGLGNVIAQVGVAALLPVWWVRCVARDVLAKANALRDPGGPWLASWLLFWLVSFLFSASSLGIGGNALGFIMLALYLHPAHQPGQTRA